MDDTLQLIDQLIEEHHIAAEKVGSLANDASFLANLKKARDSFAPGDAAEREGLKKLAEMFTSIDALFNGHFDREETILKPAMAKDGGASLANAFATLLFEHTDLRDRLLHTRKRIDELLGGSLEGTRREAAARDLRVHINHTRTLLETHAARENHLFAEFGQRLKKTTRGKEKP